MTSFGASFIIFGLIIIPSLAIPLSAVTTCNGVVKKPNCPIEVKYVLPIFQSFLKTFFFHSGSGTNPIFSLNLAIPVFSPKLKE
jgi:hypothetical protein